MLRLLRARGKPADVGLAARFHRTRGRTGFPEPDALQRGRPAQLQPSLHVVSRRERRSQRHDRRDRARGPHPRKRRNLARRADDHLPPSPEPALAGRASADRARRRVLVSRIVDPRNNVATRVGYDEVQAIRAHGDRTVVIRLRRPFSPFVQYFFGPQGVGAIMPSHLLAGRRRPQPRRLQRAAGRFGAVSRGPLEPRRQHRARGQPAVLAREAAYRPPGLPHHPRSEHAPAAAAHRRGRRLLRRRPAALAAAAIDRRRVSRDDARERPARVALQPARSGGARPQRPARHRDGDRPQDAADRRHARQRPHRRRRPAVERLGLRRVDAVDSVRPRRRAAAAARAHARRDARHRAADRQRLAVRRRDPARRASARRRARDDQAVPERHVLRAGRAGRRARRRPFRALVRCVVGPRQRPRRLAGTWPAISCRPPASTTRVWCDARADAAMRDALATVDRRRRAADYATCSARSRATFPSSRSGKSAFPTRTGPT